MTIPHRRRGTAIPLALSPRRNSNAAPLQGSPPQSSVREAFMRALLRALMTDPRGCSVATAHSARVISASAAALGEGSRAERCLPVQGLRAIGGVFPISLDGSMSEDNTANVEYSFIRDGVCART